MNPISEISDSNRKARVLILSLSEIVNKQTKEIGLQKTRIRKLEQAINDNDGNKYVCTICQEVYDIRYIGIYTPDCIECGSFTPYTSEVYCHNCAPQIFTHQCSECNIYAILRAHNHSVLTMECDDCGVGYLERIPE